MTSTDTDTAGPSVAAVIRSQIPVTTFWEVGASDFIYWLPSESQQSLGALDFYLRTIKPRRVLKVRITLTYADTYRVAFGPKSGLEEFTVVDDIYADRLADLVMDIHRGDTSGWTR